MAKSSNILILTEDFYGKDFFRYLIDRLTKEGYIKGRHRIKFEWLSRKCNPKITRKLLPKSHILDKIIIVIDAEGGDKEQAKALVDRHIPSNLKPITRYIVFDYCIEEWICDGLGIRMSGYQHPVNCLNDHLRRTRGMDYEKSMLPDFVGEIDIKRLVNNNQEFREFLNSLR